MNGVTHLRPAPEPGGTTTPARRRAQWLISVWQGTDDRPNDIVLSEGIVDSYDAVTAYACATYKATGPYLDDGTTIIWARRCPGAMMNGQWVPGGATEVATFTDGRLGDWNAGHTPTPHPRR